MLFGNKQDSTCYVQSISIILKSMDNNIQSIPEEEIIKSRSKGLHLIIALLVVIIVVLIGIFIYLFLSPNKSEAPSSTTKIVPVSHKTSSTLNPYQGWNKTTSLPTSTDFATSMVYKGYVYEIGRAFIVPYTTVDYAHINSNGTLSSWIATTSLPKITYSATFVVYNGYAYAIGGRNKSAFSTVDYAPINSNGSLGSWTTTTSLPTATYNATSVVYNGYVYEIGGFNGSAVLSTVDYAPINSNGTLGSWSSTSSLPTIIWYATSVVYNGYVYEIGGNNGSTVFSTVDYAPINSNGTLGTWSSTSSLPTATDFATSVVYNGYVYEIGGNNGSTYLSTVDYAPINSNGTLDSWTQTTSLPTATKVSTSVVYNGYIYEIIEKYPDNIITFTIDYAHIKSNGTLGF